MSNRHGTAAVLAVLLALGVPLSVGGAPTLAEADAPTLAAGSDTVIVTPERARLSSVAFSPQGDRVAMSFAGGAPSIIVRERSDEDSRSVLRGHGHVVLGLAFTPDGRRLVTGSVDASIRIWDLDRGVAVDTSRTRMPTPLLALSPDGRRLAYGGATGTVRLRPLEDPDGEGTILARHELSVTGVAFSPCGDRVASAGLDGRVRIARLEGVEEAMQAGDLLPVYRWKNDPQTVAGDVVQLGEILEEEGVVGGPRDDAPDPAGARATGSGPSSRASHYRLGAGVEPASGRVDVQLDMRWVPPEPTDTLRFFLHRDLGSPTIESPAVADVRVEPYMRFAEAFDADSSYTNRVTVALARTATSEDPVELHWSYGGVLSTDRFRLGGSALESHWVELQVGSVWLPTGASLREQFTFEAELTLPAGWEVVSTGTVERVGRSHRIRSTVPAPDAPTIASDRFRTRRREGGGPSVTVYHAGATDSVVQFVADEAARLLARYDGRFRTGRDLDDLRITIPPVRRARPELYARPGLIALSHGSGNRTGASTYRLLAHEAAHLWWTDASDTQSRHNFLNESFAEYEAWLSLREAYGEDLFQTRLEDARATAAKTPGLDEWSGRLNDPMVREKGPWLLHRLRARVGAEGYLRFVRELQRRSTGTLEAMIHVLAETTDEETAAWFEERLYAGPSPERGGR